MADPIADLFFGLGESITRYGTVTRRTTRAEDIAETSTRASTALERGKDMQIRTADPDVLRTEWEDQDGDGVAETALTLLEGQRTNGWTESERFDSPSWAPGLVRATIQSNATTAPDGFETADKLVEDATAAAIHGMARDAPPLTDNTLQSVTIHAAPAGRNWLIIRTMDKSGAELRTWFNVATGTVGTTAVGHTVIPMESVGHGFYRFGVVFDSLAGATAPSVSFDLADADGSPSYDGDGVSGLHIWGAQIEVDQPFHSTYIPTSPYLIQTDSGGVWNLNCPGTTGNGATAPYLAAYDHAADLDVRVLIAPGALSGLPYILARDDGGSQRSAYLALDPDGRARFVFFTGGGGANTRITTDPLPEQQAMFWLRATLDGDNEAGGNDVVFQTMPYRGSTWVEVEKITSGLPVAPDNSTAGISVGARETLTNPFAGRIYRAQWWVGIEEQGGTRVFDADYTDVSTHTADREKILEKALGATVGTTATSSTVTRAEDFLSVPWPYAPNVTHTGYVAFRETGASLTIGGRLFSLGGDTPPYLRVLQGPGGYRVEHHNGTASAESLVAATIPLGAWVEARYEYDGETGEVTVGLDVNQAGEVVGTPATPGTPADEWSAATAHFGNSGAANPEYGYMKGAVAKFATGKRSQAVMRAL